MKVLKVLPAMVLLAAYVALPFMVLNGCEEKERPKAPPTKENAPEKSWHFVPSATHDGFYVDKIKLEDKFFYVFRRYNSEGGLMVLPCGPESESQ